MPTTIGSLRRLLLTPSLREVTFAVRGFPPGPPEAVRRLEAIPQAVICGFEWGVDTRDQWELERRLELVEPEQRGFAYEGATMACTVVDAMGGGRGRRTKELLLGPGRPHIFLTYIGVGFAMARLPRPLWKKVMPDLTGSPYYPAMTWLAVDGYGFDRAYFETSRWVDEQRPLPPYPWEGRADYFPHAIDQGIGRALWFIHAGQVAGVASAVNRFAAGRHADLWSGVGLAATFAGGSDAGGLAALRREAGEHWEQLAQGAVFAAKARHYAGYVPEHSAAGVSILADLTVQAAVAVADDSAVEPGDKSAAPAYELWRKNVRARLNSREQV